MTDRLRAAVIGLGQVAWRFDEEAGRRMVWTHCGAYAALSDDYVLTGACDSDSDTRAAFAHRYPEVPVADIDHRQAEQARLDKPARRIAEHQRGVTERVGIEPRAQGIDERRPRPFAHEIQYLIARARAAGIAVGRG